MMTRTTTVCATALALLLPVFVQPAAADQPRRRERVENIRDRAENQRDRTENRLDRREDRRDLREDRRDAQIVGGRRDRRENRWDRRF